MKAKRSLRSQPSPFPYLPGKGVLALLALLLTILVTFPAFAQTFPPLTGRVVDQAHLLSPDQAAQLDAKLAQLEQQSGHQMVVATVNSLEGYEIEDYANRLFRTWKLGQAKANDGLLVLVAPAEHKVRIEVGYGLEGIVTDALSSIIIRHQITPAFRSGDMGGGIVAGADALIQLIQLPPDQAQARAQQMISQDRQQQRHGHIPISLFFWIIVMLFVIISHLANRFGGGQRYRGGGSIFLWGPGWGGGGWGGGSGGGWSGGDGGGWGGGGFSGGGGSSGGGGASGSW